MLPHAFLNHPAGLKKTTALPVGRETFWILNAVAYTVRLDDTLLLRLFVLVRVLFNRFIRCRWGQGFRFAVLFVDRPAAGRDVLH